MDYVYINNICFIACLKFVSQLEQTNIRARHWQAIFSMKESDLAVFDETLSFSMDRYLLPIPHSCDRELCSSNAASVSLFKSQTAVATFQETVIEVSY